MTKERFLFYKTYSYLGTWGKTQEPGQEKAGRDQAVNVLILPSPSSGSNPRCKGG